MMQSGETIQMQFRPKLRVYLASVMVIAAITTIVFSVVIFILGRFFANVSGDVNLMNAQLGVLPVAFLMALGFHSPLTWLKARHTKWVLTNMALIQDTDGQTTRLPILDIVVHAGLWPWNVVFSVSGTSVYSLDYIDLNGAARSALKSAVQTANS